ncbi:related to short chain dehydrogenase [Cephalotrichum gorgonifer]|uniref:Related to short chain dehydrogenase n=1 Tax=Cephalotrichum gorgonifer TaxID=2041049 RepID=A0AAE8SQS6_9PEZI|nr:related to short chain dehydrogenase [Cephalotrichum gorgonifer]
MSTLAGKVALISGSSQGLGAAIAKELFDRGASVVINYPYPGEKANADKVLQSLGAPNRAIAIEADLSTLEGPKALADAAAAAFGKIDILVNSAGINRPTFLDDPDDTMVEKAWHDITHLNGRGVFFLTRAVLKYLSRENSRIINIGSSATRAPASESSIYAGAKGLAEVYTQCWATELPRKYGCTVNAVAPGLVGTEAYWAAPAALRDFLQPIVDATPVAARLGTPEEVAWVVGMLAEEKAGWINGAYLPVNGGSTIW